MKTNSLFSVVAAVAVFLGNHGSSFGQEPVSTGIVQGLVLRTGTLTMRSDQTSRPFTFHGMDRATIFTEDGQPALLSDISPGMRVTVQYAVRGNRWYVSKVILAGEPRGTVRGAPLYIDPALRSPAALDDDITTEPGSNARFDNDITTQPANNAAFDNDITTQPASRSYGTGITVRRRNP